VVGSEGTVEGFKWSNEAKEEGGAADTNGIENTKRDGKADTKILKGGKKPEFGCCFKKNVRVRSKRYLLNRYGTEELKKNTWVRSSPGSQNGVCLKEINTRVNPFKIQTTVTRRRTRTLSLTAASKITSI